MLSRRGMLWGMLGVGAVAAAGLPIPEPKLLPPRKGVMSLRLGKLPARPHDGLKFRNYLTKKSSLPSVPENFGHHGMVHDFGMLANGPDPDLPPGQPPVGDCAIAGPYHAIQLWTVEAGCQANVTSPTVLKSYEDVTGYDPSLTDPVSETNPTDVGTDVQSMVLYWQHTGFPDDDGKVHRIDAALALTPGDIDELWTALYLFDGAGIGIQMPAEWMQAFQNHRPWDKLKNPHIEGGHYITGVGRQDGNLLVVTWGGVQAVTPAGYEQFNDETFVYLSLDRFAASGKDIDGFDYQALLADLRELNR